MKFKDYQEKSVETLAESSNYDFQLSILGLGITGEAGEVADYLKKVLGHGHTMDLNVLKKELGDVLWYIATICHKTGLNMDDVAKTNIEKLKKRYPNGFSEKRSINREE